MIKNNHAPGAADFAGELYNVLLKKKARVFMALFNKLPEADMLARACRAAGTDIEAVLYDEALAPAKPVTGLTAFYRNEKYPFVSLEDIRRLQEEDGETEIIIVSSHIPALQGIVAEALDRYGIGCLLYHVMDIPHSTVNDRGFFVINDVEYLKTWPAHLEKLQGEYMTDEEKKRYMTGKYPYQISSRGKYFCLQNHKSVLTDISDGYISHGLYRPAEGKPKKTVTVIGDSRMINMTVPVRMSTVSMLQQKFIDAGINAEVKNFSTIANNLQNAWAQIQSLELDSTDIILFNVYTIGSFFNSFPSAVSSPVTESTDEILRLKLAFLRKINDYVVSKGADILFVSFPSVHDVPNMTETEKEISSWYGFTFRPLKSMRKLGSLCAANGLKFRDFSAELFSAERTSLFVDETHFSYEASLLIADMLFDCLSGMLSSGIPDPESEALLSRSMDIHYRFTESVLPSRNEESREYINYLRTVSMGKPENRGIIVMNCNPFTLGHLYLVEEARKQVDYLYIMVVPEENPHFSFRDRYEMAKNAVKNMDNVEVIRSGNIYATRVTFPAYFERDKNPDAVCDASEDIYIFCTQIAPALGVTKRFVGTEPNDRVTAQFNQMLKAELPESGIELVEIQRRELDNVAVSASKVRKYLKEKNYSEVRKIVPESTYEYIRETIGL